METKNQKLMINFAKRKVIAVKFHAGSVEYNALTSKGYIEVGVIKQDKEVFIKPEYFDFNDKYLDPPKMDTITT